MNLLPHQKKAIEHVQRWKVGALFMKMGTGKTRVTVELVNKVVGIDLVVYVAPLRIIKPLHHGVPSIIDEVNKWGGFVAQEVIYIGVETISQSDRQYVELLNRVKQAKSAFLIVDEGIKIKNILSKRTHRVIDLSELVEYKLILNGEPITRDLLDMYSQMLFLDPRIVNMNYNQFKNTFCVYTTRTKRIKGKYVSWETITGYENVGYFYSLIGQYVFECDLDLNIEQLHEEAFYIVDGEDRLNYDEIKRSYLTEERLMLLDNNIFLRMTQELQHSYCCAEDKFYAVDEWVSRYSEEECIIFVKYIKSEEACKKRYPKATVLNYKTGSYGLNLQHLPYTVFFDRTFDYGDISQAIHRNYRMGQESDCRYLSLTGNVGLEKMIRRNNQKKVDMIDYFKRISREELRNEL